MDWVVCSRETERDYTWDNTHAGSSLAEYAQRFFAPAFEGSITRSRFSAFLRCPGTIQDVILCISVFTNRRDFSHTPIRTLAFLRAESAEETDILAAFFAECLRKSDTETLYDPESGVAKAVESLYQTKKPDEFVRFCESLKPVDGKGGAPKDRFAFPRGGMAERNLLADALPAAITGNSPFLFALTDRRWTDVLASLGSLFDRGTVWIFSKATTVKEPIPGGPPNTRAVAAAIGGTVLFAVLFAAAIGGPCSRRGGGGEAGRGGGEAVRETNVVVGPIDGGHVATNVPPICRIDATNTVATKGRSIEPASETRPGGVSTNADPASSKTPAAVTNEADPSVIGEGIESAASTNLLTRAIGDECVATNAQASVGLDATNAVPANDSVFEINLISQKANPAPPTLIQDADEAAETKGEAAEAAEEAAEAAEEAAETADEVAETTDEAAETADEVAETTDEVAGTADEATQAERDDNEPESLSPIPQQAP